MPSGKTALHKSRKISIRPRKALKTRRAEDRLAVEEPMEIRIYDEPLSTLLRTPGDDMPLAAGFLYSLGLLNRSADIGTLGHLDGAGGRRRPRNVVVLTYAEGRRTDTRRLRRAILKSGLSGASGKEAFMDQLRELAGKVSSPIRLGLDIVYSLGKSLRRAQDLFEQTGGLHAAGVFDEHGVLHTLHEDVNPAYAADKAIGQMLLKGRAPLDHHILMVGGRVGFEIVQKAVMARMPMICAVSAPTSLAVETAREFGVTLVGFLREDDFNVYTHAERIAVSP
jgi:FdhD protein